MGVATTWNEAAPCNISLDAARRRPPSAGVKAAAARRASSRTITVTDGIAMGHEGMKSSLVAAR